MADKVYVLLEAMTDADIAYTVNRLHREAKRARPEKVFRRGSQCPPC